MGNCLVTKLKGVVDNDNLPILGMTELKIPTGTFSEYNALIFDSSVTVQILGGTINGETSSTMQLYSWTGVPIVSDGTYDGYVILRFPKYKVTRLDLNQCKGVDYSEFKYGVLNRINVVCSSWNLNALESKFADFTGLSVTNYNSEVADLTNLGKNGKLAHCSFNNGVSFNGSFDNIGCSPLDENWEIFFPTTQNVSFVVENFVANKRLRGQTTGEQNNFAWMGLCNATFNGNKITHKNHYTLSWTADTITFDGVTINA
jgi:hypothetical protein